MEQIIIRKARMGDGKGIADSFNAGLKGGFNNYTGGNEPFGREKINKLNKQFSRYQKGACHFVAIDRKTGKIIGSCLFFGKDKGRVRHRVECGGGVHPDYMKKGIATRMVRELIKEARRRRFKRIEAEAAVKNTGSVKLARRLGFKIEGRKKAGLVLDNGKYVDTYIFGMILE